MNEHLSIPERIALIFREVGAAHGKLGFAHRGVASWDQDKLHDWQDLEELSIEDYEKLNEIEMQVFGKGKKR